MRPAQGNPGGFVIAGGFQLIDRQSRASLITAAFFTPVAETANKDPQWNLTPLEPFWGWRCAMGLEIFFFIGAFILLVALIFGTLQGHYRSRRSVRVGDELVRNRYKRNQG
jgi:hypothetical protein